MVAGVQDPRFVKENWAEKELPKEEWEEAALKEALDDATANLSSDYFTILLAHRPEFWPLYQAYPIDLVLSGHAHGGQFRLPLTEGLSHRDKVSCQNGQLAFTGLEGKHLLLAAV